MENDKQEPIAIVGMGCRFPGDADTPNGFWELLSKGESAWSKVPRNRFNIDGFHHPSSDRGGAITANSGFFLKQDAAKWDASFFSMTPAEAAGTDPQQRILLEVAYEAFENAGMSVKDVAGSLTSCYMGSFNADYKQTSMSYIWDTNPYSATGLGMAMISNRLSWFFDLRGGSMTIDTACSSSLIAMHLGIQSLRTGEAKMSIVGGANLILEPETMRGLSALRFLSPDGKCHSFDESANGYARGEGFGVLVLKPLKDALRDNDTIRAVIRGSYVNQDGKTPAITVPSREAQADLINTAYENAGLDLSGTQYFEAHGTGTAVGDPIELSGIGCSVGAGRTEDNALYVGSVKTNLGHLEATAGMGGVIKTVLAMEHGLIPSVVGLESINPRIQLEEWGLKLNTDLVPWPMCDVRRASVNSFGYGGANAHVILDDAKHYLEQRRLVGNHATVGHQMESTDCDNSDSGVSVGSPTSESGSFPASQKAPFRSPKLLVLSSPEQGGTARLAETYATYLDARKQQLQAQMEATDNLVSSDPDYLENLAYTLGERRSAFDWRTFAVAGSVEEFQTAAQRNLPNLRRIARNPAYACVFTGQGSQYFNMGRGLQSNAVFLHSVQLADKYLTSLGCTWSVLEEMNKSEELSNINAPELSQPICTILQVAIVDLLKHWGTSPNAVVGHSSGEIGAAYAAGILSREDAWKVAYYRGLFSGNLPKAHPELDGIMMAVALSEDAALEFVKRATTGKVVAACINSPLSVTLSGDKTAIEEVQKLLEADNVWCRTLKVTTAYHSHHMNFIADEYLKSIEDIKPLETDGSIRMFSSVTGKRVQPVDLGASYWVQNMLSTVRFSSAISALLAPTNARSRRQKLPSVQLLLEIGPHSVLKGPLNQILGASATGYENAVAYVSVLQRGTDAYESAVISAGKLWGAGQDLNLAKINSADEVPARRKVLTDLPPYPWNHERSHWHEPRPNAFKRLHARPRTDLLGYPADNFDPLSSEHRWVNFLKPFELPWVQDHVIQGTVVFPASAMIAMALEACQQLVDPAKNLEGFEFRDVNFTRALIFVTADCSQEVSMQFRPHVLGTRASTYVWHKFNMNSISPEGVTAEHCNGLVRVKYATKASEVENGLEAALEAKNYKETYAEISSKCDTEVNVPQLYSDINTEGMQFGPLFRLLSEMRGGEDVGVASLTIPDTAAVMPSNRESPLLLHPCVLDGIFQMMFSRSAASANTTGTMSVIAYVGSLFISADLPSSPGSVLRAYQSSKIMGHRDIFADIIVSDKEFAKPFVVCKQVVTTGLATERQAKSEDTTTLLATRLVWKEDVASLSQKSASLLGAAPVLIESELLKNATLLEQSAAIYIRRALSLLVLDQDSAVVQNPAIGWIRQFSTASLAEDEEAILTAAADSSSLGKVIQVIGTNLSNILNGLVDAQKLLFEQELGNSRDFTDELLCKDLLNSRIAAWFDLAGDKNPELQVVEIGNGSISAAVSILSTLASQGAAGPRYDQYTFVESDSSRVADVNALLKKFPNVNVQSFDIERDLVLQNITKKYDVVVINNMMPAIADIDAALKNAKVLLKPGGTLIIAALSKLSTRAALVLGVLEKWWIARGVNDPQTRYLPQKALYQLLLDNGMASPEILIPDSQDSHFHQMSMILSTSPKREVQKLQPVVILESAQMAPSTSVLSSNILESLVGQGFSVVKSTLAAMPEPANTFFISLIDIDGPLLDGLSEEDFSNLRSLTTKSAGVLWMTRGGMKTGDALPNHAALIGLFRTVRAEAPHLRLFTLDLSSTTDIASTVPSNLILRIFNTSFSEDEDAVIDYEYTESDGTIFIPRLIQDEAMNTSLVERTELPSPESAPLFQSGRPLKMVMGELGLLDTMRFVDREELQGPLPADCIDIQILATGLNFVDIMAALGYIPSPALGAEYSGIITAIGSEVLEDECHVGQIVVGSAECCIGSNVRVHWKTVNEVPKGMAPEAAATCLIAYATAYFALYDNSRLKPTDTILIHYAAGGLGQAAIQLASHIGATIYCTVGSLEKKNLIMEQYGIPENRIFNSRDMTFKQGIMRETKDRGVDVILNSTFGEMLRETWNCLADHGTMVEVGKRDILSNNSLEMAPFIRGCTFSALNLAQYTADSEPHRLQNYQEVVKKVFKLLGDGIITTPYPLHVMNVTEAEEAFRALQSGKFSGKTVLKMNPDAIVPVLPKKKEPLELDPDATYLLAGGLGGIGRSLSSLLERHGAKNIVFVSRSGDRSDAAKTTLEKLREKGVNAVAYTCDITDREALEAVLQTCSAEMPTIKGFVNCAMLLKDAIFENMTHSDWVAATGPKIQGSWNMHELLPSSLDFFIMLSSTSGIIGNPGQANYAAGNTFQNGLAHYRRRKGLKATSIDLSAVAGIGYLAENSAAYEQRKTLMKMTIKEDEIHHIFLAAIEGIIKGDQEMPPQITTGIIGGEVLRSLLPVAPWANDSKFILLRKADGLSGSSGGGDTAMRDAFLVSESIAEAAVIVEMALTGRLAKALFINSEDIDIAKPLHSYGVDSLIAVEVRNWVMKEIKSDISILDILSPMPISQLAHKIAEDSKLLPASFRPEVLDIKVAGAEVAEG